MLPQCSRLTFSLPFLRSISSSGINLNRNHYDVLEVTPKATQADIKSSYYKLSKAYHPDTAKSEDAVQKFREVTAAYEVLGNVKLRRLYDKGMHHVISKTQTARHSHEEEDDASTRFYKSREVRHRPPAPTGRTTHYDFDEWSRSHYGSLFSRNMSIKKNQENKRIRDIETANDIKIENVLFCLGFLGVLVCYLISDIGSYDTPRNKTDGNEVPSNVKK